MKNFPILKNSKGQSLDINWLKTIIHPLEIIVNYLISYSDIMNPDYQQTAIAQGYDLSQLTYKKYWLFEGFEDEGESITSINIDLNGESKTITSGTIILNNTNHIDAASYLPNYDISKYTWNDFLIQKKGFAGYFLTTANGPSINLSYDPYAESSHGLIYECDVFANRAYHLNINESFQDCSLTGEINHECEDGEILPWINPSVPLMIGCFEDNGDGGWSEIITDYKWSITSDIINKDVGDRQIQLTLNITDAETIPNTFIEVR